MDKITCPYCSEEFELNHDDGAHYDENESEEEECPHCGKIMLVDAWCIWDYEAKKADCLNGADCEFNEWRRGYSNEETGIELQYRYCSMCHKREERTINLTNK